MNNILSVNEKFNRVVKQNLPLILMEAEMLANYNYVCDKDDYQQEAYLTIFRGIVNNEDPFTIRSNVRKAIRNQANKFCAA